MKLKKILDQNFTELPSEGNQKLTIYKCAHCDQTYARHATRMGLHLLRCKNCPNDIKETLKGKVSHTYLDALNSKNPVMWTKVMENFIRHPAQGNQKLDTYVCKYCSKKYSRNATRMNIHLLQCQNCPSSVKEVLSRISKGNSRDGTSNHNRSRISKKILDECFVMKPPEQNQKLDLFQCKYCSQKYARHATRMSLHLTKCAGCPLMIKQALMAKVRESNVNTILPRKSLLKFKRIVEHYYLILPRQANEKIQFVKCKYCALKFARHSTRMTLHLLKCRTCPPSIREHVKRYANENNITETVTEKNTVTITKQDQTYCQDLFAKAVYASGAPLTLVENDYWREFFNAVNPAFILPSKYELSNSLLDRSYRNVKMQVDKIIEVADSIGIQCDSGYEELVNVVLTTPEPMFHKTIVLQNNVNDGIDFAEKLSNIIEEIGSEKILGVCLEKSTVNDNVIQILQKKYEDVYFYNCILQSLNRLMKYIIDQGSVSQILKNATSIVKEIKNSSTLSSILNDIQRSASENNIVALELPVKLRWSSYILCLESIFENKSNLQDLVTTDIVDDVVSESSKVLILDHDFWLTVSKLIELMKPLDKWIAHMKSTDSNISEIPEMFMALEKQFSRDNEDFESSSVLTSSEMDKVLEKIKFDIQSVLHPIHYAANILNPTFKGESLTQDDFVEGTSLISKLSMKFQIPEDNVLIDLANYNSCKGIWSENYIKKSIALMSSSNWWKGVCKCSSLSKIAGAVLDLPHTSVAAIKKRSVIKDDNEGKIAFISHNLKLLESSAKLKLDLQDEVSVQPSQEGVYNVTNFEMANGDYDQVFVQEDFKEANEVLSINPIETESVESFQPEVKISLTNVKQEKEPEVYYQIVNSDGQIYLVKQDK